MARKPAAAVVLVEALALAPPVFLFCAGATLLTHGIAIADKTARKAKASRA